MPKKDIKAITIGILESIARNLLDPDKIVDIVRQVPPLDMAAQPKSELNIVFGAMTLGREGMLILIRLYGSVSN
jgi:hypothetical protein